MSTSFKVFARVFIDVRRSQDAIDSALGWQRNWTDCCSVGSICRVYYLFAGGIEQTTVKMLSNECEFLLLKGCHFLSLNCQGSVKVCHLVIGHLFIGDK